MVAEAGLDCLGCASYGAAAAKTGGWQMPTGHLHLDEFESPAHSRRKEKSHPDWDDFFFSGCGGRTRTYDLRVMSPTSFQLLYSAILSCTLECLDIIAQLPFFVNPIFWSYSVVSRH